VTAIVLSLGIALAVNGAFFAVAAARRTDVVTDLSYSLTFALLAVVLLLTGAAEPVQLVASLLVVVWAVRLGTYLFRRIMRMKVDHRFDGMRDEPLRFARFWLLQAITVAVVMLPVSYLLDQENPPGLGVWSVVGAAVWLVGLLVEVIADAQKSAFRAKEENSERFIASGLWRYSRHPNYFFEWLHWFTYVFLAVGGHLFWLSLAGPVVMFAFLYRVSGIPWTEAQSLRSRGEDYRTYQRQVSAFFPWPPRHD